MSDEKYDYTIVENQALPKDVEDRAIERIMNNPDQGQGTKPAVVLICPVCKREPQYLTHNRNRGDHPSIAEGRFSCGLQGHIVASSWTDLGLGAKVDDPALKDAARQTWIREFQSAGIVSEEIKLACETLRREMEDIDVAAIPTKPDVYTLCGPRARNVYDALSCVTRALFRI